ncbi:anti-sigma-D factor RsdA [Mycobacterium decipiens]|uniref:Anti-sigma-D factor RsdA sigma factor binding region domain-containing protein n=1 Tax=Mycobacterium decipiens TaxID=1430326 RepID=A0A1X2M1H0_9MYCO|nr:anti-sigma-D factor RsdA [Mycobacterium decipiens]OSC42999.1 hypothetical protein B8W66_00865 [Mycobacterium decipiens]
MRNSGPDFGHALGDQPALDEVAQADLFLDALAERATVDVDDPDDDALAALLGEWRDDLRWPPASALVSQDEAIDALRTGVAARQRARRGLAAIGSVAATLLVLSGFGAVVADARPGDLLYGLHAMMFNRARVGDDQIVLSAKAELAKVQQMIAQGQWDQAETQLAEVSSTLQAVNDGSRRQDLIDEVNLLNTKVETRDPNATLRPGSPSDSAAVPATPGSVGDSWTPPAPGTELPAPPAPALASEPPTSSGDPVGAAPTGPMSPEPSPSPSGATPATTSPPTPTPSLVAPGESPAGTQTSPAAGATQPSPSLETADAATNPPSPMAQTSGQAAPEKPASPAP